jgi:hypothetical protein
MDHTLANPEVYKTRLIFIKEMALDAGVYRTIWCATGTKGGEIIEPLNAGIKQLKATPAYFVRYDAIISNSRVSVSYTDFLARLEAYLQACQDNPEATITLFRFSPAKIPVDFAPQYPSRQLEIERGFKAIRGGHYTYHPRQRASKPLLDLGLTFEHYNFVHHTPPLINLVVTNRENAPRTQEAVETAQPVLPLGENKQEIFTYRLNFQLLMALLATGANKPYYQGLIVHRHPPRQEIKVCVIYSQGQIVIYLWAEVD